MQKKNRNATTPSTNFLILIFNLFQLALPYCPIAYGRTKDYRSKKNPPALPGDLFKEAMKDT
jgi:hypothetical protein